MCIVVINMRAFHSIPLCFLLCWCRQSVGGHEAELEHDRFPADSQILLASPHVHVVNLR